MTQRQKQIAFALAASAPAMCLLLSCATPEKKEPPTCTASSGAVVPCSGSDGDGDGIDDAVDECPTMPEIENGIDDTDGCPDPDEDRDGIVDEDDACPSAKGGAPDGCPEQDTDADGVADRFDACPKRAEDVDGDNDGDGCPEGKRLLLPDESEELFAQGSIGRQAKMTAPELESLLAQIRERRGRITRVEVEATDTESSFTKKFRSAIVTAGAEKQNVTVVLLPKRQAAKDKSTIKFRAWSAVKSGHKDETHSSVGTAEQDEPQNEGTVAEKGAGTESDSVQSGQKDPEKSSTNGGAGAADQSNRTKNGRNVSQNEESDPSPDRKNVSEGLHPDGDEWDADALNPAKKTP